VQGYMGGYSDYIEAKQAAIAVHTSKNKQPVSVSAPAAKKSSDKMSYKFKYELEQLPSRIDALTQEIASLKETLSTPDIYTTDPKKFAILTARLAEAES